VSDPRIPVVLHTPFGDVTSSFIIDTGADFSLAPRSVAEEAGLDWSTLPVADLLGIGGGMISARLGPLRLRIGEMEATVRCVFAESPMTPFILGRADFLERFRLTIDARLRRITITEH